MQILTEQRFECIKTTKEWKSKIRLWNGSEPIQQIHTRDPMSTATLLYYKEVGERCYSNQATSSSGIGTSGRRPLASDPHALCSSQNWMTRWNAFLGKTTLTTKKGRAESKIETVTMRVTEETRCEGCQECEVQYCNCQQLGKDTTVATTMPEETPSHQDCLVQYCNCKQPWDEMLIEESDDAMNVCTMLISVSPCIDLEEETLGGHCWAVELDQEATQVLPRRSTRQRLGKKRVEPTPTLSKSKGYELEKIIAERRNVKDELEFLCKWRGYDDTFNSWIAEERLSQAQGLLKGWRTENPIPKGNNPCGIHVTPGMVYTHDPQITDMNLDVAGGLGAKPGLDTQAPTSFQPQLETIASKMLRESQSLATAQCLELKILMYLVKNGWRKSPETEQIEHLQVFEKYHRYRDYLREVNGSIYRMRMEDVDNEGLDQVKPPSCGRELQWIPPLRKRWNILLQTHATPDVGHPGAKVMLKRILDVMWWPDITKHVKMLTETCQICQCAKRRKDPLQGSATILKYKLPNSELLIDVIEGLPVARNGWRYVTAITCASSRYTGLYIWGEE